VEVVAFDSYLIADELVVGCREHQFVRSLEPINSRVPPQQPWLRLAALAEVRALGETDVLWVDLGARIAGNLCPLPDEWSGP
jgi:hypothetical protein